MSVGEDCQIVTLGDLGEVLLEVTKDVSLGLVLGDGLIELDLDD